MTESKETPPHFACAESLYRAKQPLAQAGIDGTYSTQLLSQFDPGYWPNRAVFRPWNK